MWRVWQSRFVTFLRNLSEPARYWILAAAFALAALANLPSLLERPSGPRYVIVVAFVVVFVLNLAAARIARRRLARNETLSTRERRM